MSQVTLTGIRTVVFDLDDTLYAERDFAFSGFDAVADWLTRQVHCPFDPARRMRELFDTEHRARVFNRLLEELPCPELRKQQLVPELIDRYRSHLPKIDMLPDARRAFQRWERRFFLALVSDGPETTQANKVKALDIQDRLNLVVLTDAWGRQYWKPHRRAFETIEQVGGHAASACVYIADNPIKDFVAPRQMGWHTVRVRRPDGIYRSALPPTDGAADHTVESLDAVDIST